MRRRSIWINKKKYFMLEKHRKKLMDLSTKKISLHSLRGKIEIKNETKSMSNNNNSIFSLLSLSLKSEERMQHVAKDKKQT